MASFIVKLPKTDELTPRRVWSGHRSSRRHRPGGVSPSALPSEHASQQRTWSLSSARRAPLAEAEPKKPPRPHRWSRDRRHRRSRERQHLYVRELSSPFQSLPLLGASAGGTGGRRSHWRPPPRRGRWLPARTARAVGLDHISRPLAAPIEHLALVNNETDLHPELPQDDPERTKAHSRYPSSQPVAPTMQPREPRPVRSIPDRVDDRAPNIVRGSATGKPRLIPVPWSVHRATNQGALLRRECRLVTKRTRSWSSPAEPDRL